MAAAFSNIFALNESAEIRAAPGVLAISDGVSTLMRMPLRFSSSAAALENIRIAAIAAPISVSPGVATLAASEATLTITPDLCARRTGSTACIICRGGKISSLRRCWIASIGTRSSNCGGWLGPVVQTSTSIPPKPSRATLAASTADAGFVASTCTYCTAAPGTRSRMLSHAVRPRSALRPSSAV